MSRTADDMQAHGVARVVQMLLHWDRVLLITEFAHEALEPKPGQMLFNIDGYDYLVTVEFQDPR